MSSSELPNVENNASEPVPEAKPIDRAAKEAEERKRLPPGQRTYRRVELPTPEMMQQDEFMNNCATRTILSAGMGSALGVVFGIFMGTMESSVRVCMYLYVFTAVPPPPHIFTFPHNSSTLCRPSMVH